METHEDYSEKANNVRNKLFIKRRTVKWAADQLKKSRQYLHAVFSGKEQRPDLLEKLDEILDNLDEFAALAA